MAAVVGVRIGLAVLSGRHATELVMNTLASSM